jgi:uncharacterized protein
MSTDRTIGRTVKIKTYQALVELSPDTSSYVKSSYGGLYAIAVINSFVILPVGSERVVAIVTALDMAEEPEATIQNRQMLVIARPRRTMWVSMIGTITQGAREGKHFEYGVRRYPELDNPVWFASEDDLDIIFDKKGRSDPRHVTIGKSPIFTDYEVTIDIDRFFGKHAAILGNTGAGKSCTVTAVIKAVLERGMPNAHFVILDTNNEYEQAFTEAGVDNPAQKVPLFDRLVLRNDGDIPKGLIVPHWFMNGLDYQAFFRPGEGAQAPLLFKAIGVARGKGQPKSAVLNVIHRVEETLAAIDTIVTESPKSKVSFKGKEQLREQLLPLAAFLDQEKSVFSAVGLTGTWEATKSATENMLQEAEQTTDARRATHPSEPITALIADRITKEVTSIRAEFTQANHALLTDSNAPIGIDTPLHFDFNEFIDFIFADELQREAGRDAKLRSYAGTLQLRLEQARLDPRYSFLFHVKPFPHALASFLRLLLGIDPAKHFGEARPPWAAAYEDQYAEPKRTHQVTILDLSQLSSDVLENVTALLGRLVLEFMQRIPDRGSFPVVLVLEEAHRYIPENAPLDRQQRARDVFEKIAKEGRKFGLSLVVASQRPSELSRTVLAQCNSFIVHRIQNPDDQQYFRSVISGINRELLDQLPALAQQQAIVMGDCVRRPLQVRINTVDPRPRSIDPEFVGIWSNPRSGVPDVERIALKWEGKESE